MYRDSDGAVYDFRPAEGKPTVRNFKNMDTKTLQSQLMVAYKNQRKALEEGKAYDKASEMQITKSLSDKIGKLEKIYG